MQPPIDHARSIGRRPEDFASPAHGRSAQVLFVTCSDSRVVPALITGARPGQLLDPHTAGAIVPPPTSDRPTYEVHTDAVHAQRPDTDTFEALCGAR
ncbi:hypothetical protein GCM10023335_32760 [Streptomyces siamensis]|uniref:carbonic anhydrase n=1 Tax=Streptomyces siamensis TaxID=1274986 RepID=A0ABP9IY46_9ACTN